MGREAITAWRWQCDTCKRAKILAKDDEELPYGWVAEGTHAFCCHSHYAEWVKKCEAARQ